MTNFVLWLWLHFYNDNQEKANPSLVDTPFQQLSDEQTKTLLLVDKAVLAFLSSQPCLRL